MAGLTSLGVFHTAIALIALFSGFGALFRYREISPNKGLGLIYLVTTCILLRPASGSSSTAASARRISCRS
jgi:hypothetical protein